jgi:transposase
MRIDELYPHNGFTHTQVSKTSGKVIQKAVRTSRSAVSPYCQTLSKKRHSYYVRKPQAMPCSITPVQLILRVQRYFCQNPVCIHTTFAERIPDTSRFYSRKTIHLEALLQVLAFEMSAETVARVCKRLKVQVSPDSVLSSIRKTDALQNPYVRVLGVDDWAFRKGQNYGTLLVDLEKHKTIDLLPDRTQHTLSHWLRDHPEIEIISRDRSFEYKAGIDTGAPQALQVVDRWHLLHNLQEKLQEVIPAQLKRQKTDQKKKETPSYQKRRKYFDLVHYLDGKGHSQRRIARVLGISRGTVRSYLELADVPDWQTRSHAPSQLDVYRDFLRTRWDEGCRDVTLLWKELQQRGYPGQRKSVAEYLQRFCTRSPFRSNRQLAWLFMKDTEGLQEEERNYLNALFVGNQKLQEIYLLVQSFRGMLAQRSPQTLDDWLAKMESCDVKKLQNFASSLRQDYEAVKAALSYDWSNGQVEGQVNRLKTIKHQMYGRANFDLLRLRILGPPK